MTSAPRTQSEVDERDDEGAGDGGEEAAGVQVGHECAGELEHEGVHHQQRQPKGEDDCWQRQQDDEWAQRKVDETEDGAGEQQRAPVVLVADGRDDDGGCEQRDAVAQPGEEQTSGQSSSIARMVCSSGSFSRMERRTSRSGAWPRWRSLSNRRTALWVIFIC